MGIQVLPTAVKLCENCRYASETGRLIQCRECHATHTSFSRVQYYESTDCTLCVYCQAQRNTREYTKTFKVNRSERLVGYELEFYVPRGARLNMAAWGRLHGDGSIRPTNGCDGREFASYPFCGDYLFGTITASTGHLLEKGAEVNHSCGVHTHFCVATDTDEMRHNIREWWPVMEPLFAGMVDSRRRNNDFCTLVNSIRNSDERYGSRYRALNTEAFHEHGTYEVRLHHGSLNDEELIGWTQVMLGFFDRFGKLEAKKKLLSAVRGLSPRGQLLYFMQHSQLGLKVRKHCIHRFMKYGLGTTGYSETYLNKQGKEVLHLEEVS